MPDLCRLPRGSRGRILTLSGEAALVQRLYEIGLYEGETIEALGGAPLGDPLEFRVGNTRLSLRKSEAAAVEWEPL